ncbi:MAG: secondary thiamine-phosphate synthase enzyme YjbQ [archaeon]
MNHFLKKEEIETRDHSRVYDITSPIEKAIEESKIKNGHILIQPLHTTVGIYLNEGEPRLLEDLVIQLNKRAPQTKGAYLHDDIDKREDDCPDDEPENGHSHIKATFYSNPSLALVLYNEKLQIGKYQRILFAEFDGPCPRKHKNKRQYLISIIGE